MSQNPAVDGAPAVPDDETPVVETSIAQNPEVETDEAAAGTQEVLDSDESKTVPLSEVKKIRSEAASLRQRLKSAEGKTGTLETERDALREERDALREKLDAFTLERAIVAAASDPKVGARTPARLIKLVDAANLSFKDDGSVDGLDAEIKRLKVEWPELFVSGHVTDAGAASPATALVDMNTLLRQRAGNR